MIVEVKNTDSMQDIVDQWNRDAIEIMSNLGTALVCIIMGGLLVCGLWAWIAESFYPFIILALIVILNILAIVIVYKIVHRLDKDYNESLILFNTAFVKTIKVKRNNVVFCFSKDSYSSIDLMRSFMCFSYKYNDSMDKNKIEIDYKTCRISLSGLYMLDQNDNDENDNY